jgi:hypothetical protein
MGIFVVAQLRQIAQKARQADIRAIQRLTFGKSV